MKPQGTMDFTTGEYILTTPKTAKVQENFLYNDRYFAVTFQTGNGYSVYVHPNGLYNQIIEGTHYYGHVHFYSHNRVVYVRDDDTGEFWSVGVYPVKATYDAYQCRHGAGYSIFSNLTNGIDANWRVFVPDGTDPVELWTLKFANTTRKTRKLSIFSAAELSLRTEFPLYGHEIYLRGLHLPKANGVGTRKIAMNIPHPYFGAVLLSSRKPASWETDKETFLGGESESHAAPEAVVNGRCRGSLASRYQVMGVLHHRFAIKPGSTARLDVLAGACKIDEIASETGIAREASAYHRKYLDPSGKQVDRAFDKMRKNAEARLARVQIQTPDKKFNYVFNRWAPRLMEFGATLGRWGMFGYRDIVQQNQGALTIGDTDKRRDRLELAIAHQYKSGYAIRSFPAVHEDSNMKYADSALWLVSAITEYIKETGDLAFARKRVPYLDGGSDSVINHLHLAMKALSSGTGKHGLCLMHGGDWSDSMTHIGRKGRGESVWLSEAFCYACLLIEELCQRLGDDKAAAGYRRQYERMKDAINRHAWDGKWYRRAYDDNGDPVGSAKCKQGRIFVNAQSWAMIGRIASKQRMESGIREVKRHLRTPYGYQLFTPAFSYKQDNIGRLSCIEPGTADNASVYTHGNAFFALGLLMHGYADEAWDVLTRIMPYNPNNPSRAHIEYQICNGFFGREYKFDPGRAEHGWMTGSCAWLYLALIDYLFGVRRTYDGIKLQPMLPTGWRKASIHRQYRGTDYDVIYKRPNGRGNRIEKLLIDGKPADPSQPLPIVPGKTIRVDATLA